MMKRLFATTLILLLSAWGLTSVAQADRDAIAKPAAEEPVQADISFATIDITIDPKNQPLGAYQFELTSPDGTFTVVGVEAGDHPAFDHDRPPYFDRIATKQQTDRLILAEYALPELGADKLPAQATRVATVHVMFAGPLQENEQPDLKLTLTVAGDADGNRIDAIASYTFRTPERPQ